MEDKSGIAGFRPVPRTGVIYVMTEAAKEGYKAHSPDWANLGQGAPEVGPIDGAPERMLSFKFEVNDLEYSPIDGVKELREAVATLYNERYRKGKKSQYTAENVAISSGGRVALTRAVSSLGQANVGHFLPDYTAYEELLGAFGTFTPIPILLDPDRGYEFSPDDLKKEILGRGFSALLLSNPCNPTGKVIRGEDLSTWVKIMRDTDCALIVDEFYSHYLYGLNRTSISATEYVEDVNKDPVIIVDGLTKNWRYPGFRVAWTIGPRSVIEALTSAGSFLDGGCPQPIQRAAVQLVKLELADREASAIQKNFTPKREFLLQSLKELGISVSTVPEGGFYCWGNLEHLSKDANTGVKLFQKALKQKVIIVPGAFFDINPGKRRSRRQSRFESYARFSFGPSMKELEIGVAGLKKALS